MRALDHFEAKWMMGYCSLRCNRIEAKGMQEVGPECYGADKLGRMGEKVGV